MSATRYSREWARSTLMCLACLAILATTSILGACANGQPRAEIKAPTDAIATTYSEIKSAAAATAISAKQGALTPAQAAAIKEKLQQALNAARLARIAVANGDPTAAQTLSTVNALLLEIRAEMGGAAP